MRLSQTQRAVLMKLRFADASAYQMRGSLATLNALCRMGLVQPIGYENLAFPHGAMWRITDAGKAAIFKLGKAAAQAED